MGPDGHTASLFPGASTLEAGPSELVAATEDPNGVNPHPRLTLTLSGHQFGVPGHLHRGRRVQGRRRRRPRARATTSRPPASTPGACCGWSMVQPAPSPPRLALVLTDADLLATPLPELTASARVVRDGAHGRRVTFSPKVFIPLTMLCRDRCGYCTFAKAPARLESPYLTARGGPVGRPRRGRRPDATRPCSPWVSGPSCATRWRRSGSPRRGTPRRSTTWPPCAGSSSKRPGLLPHANAGALYADELAALRPVTASQGMMLESMAEGSGRAPRRARQGAVAAPGHARGGGRTGHPVHDGDPRRDRRHAGGPAGGAAGDRGGARSARSRPRGHRAELLAQGGHRHVQGCAVPRRRPGVGDRGGAPGAATVDPRPGAAQPLRRPGAAARRGHRRLGRRVAGDGRPREPRAGLAGAGRAARGDRGGRAHARAPADDLPDVRPGPDALAGRGDALPGARCVRRRGTGP